MVYGDILQAVSQGDAVGTRQFQQVMGLYSSVVAQTKTQIIAAIDAEPDVDLRSLLLDALTLADNTWIDVRANLKRSPQKKLLQRGCYAGCSWCCHLHVDCTPVEAEAIAIYLRATLGEAELSALSTHVQETANRLASLDAKSRLPLKVPCSMLTEDGYCRIYPVRPFSCRGFNSVSADACKQSFGEIGATTPIDLWQATTFFAVMQGVIDALAEKGILQPLTEFNVALQKALSSTSQE